MIVALFYRGRRFWTSLVFAVHLHAFAFIVFTLSEAAKLTGSTGVEVAVSFAGVVTVAFAAYALLALRAVFGGGWPATVGKAAAIGVIYLIASLPAFAIILAWASVL